MRIVILYVVFGLLFGCGPSEEKKDDSTSPAVKNSAQPAEQNIYKPPVKEMFTIFHAADDSEMVYISVLGSGPGAYLLPGECILLADYDFALLTVHVGAGVMDSLLIGDFEASQIVCHYEEAACSPQNYFIKNQGSWYNDYYVMEPQKSQYKDLSKCTPIEDKFKK